MSDLNKGVIRQWVAALRSGDYKQTQRKLGRVDGDGYASYCCLGVLCELAKAEGLVQRDVAVLSLDDQVLRYDREQCLPPRAVSHYIGDPDFDYSVGLPHGLRNNGRFYEDSGPEEIELACLNDDHAWTFEQIADVLEANYLTGETVG